MAVGHAGEAGQRPRGQALAVKRIAGMTGAPEAGGSWRARQCRRSSNSALAMIT